MAIESGKKNITVVADILPPQSSEVHAATARPLPKTPTLPKNPAPPLFQKRTLPQPRVVPKERIIKSEVTHILQVPPKETSFGKNEKEPGNRRALDEWFQKERKVRTDASAPLVPVSKRKSAMKRFLAVFAVLLLLLLLGGFAASYFWGRMQVRAVLKSAPLEVNEELRVSVSPSSGTFDIEGELVELFDTREATFPVSGKDNVQSKARGVIVVYNAFDQKPQTLVANTRFESSDGKIYRIRESVTVPGAVNENGVLSPRSVEATIYADQPGPAYNKGLTDFKIPGFKGSSRYEGFYARSKTPMEGGFIGETRVVTSQDIDMARGALEQGLRDILAQKLKANVPEGFYLLDAAYEVTTDTRSFSAEAGDAANEFTGTLTLNARGLIFKKTDLERFLAGKAGLQPETVALKNGDDLALSVVLRSIDQGTLVLRVEGTARFVWNLDQELLRQRLAGTGGPGMVSSVFKEFDAIDSAEVRFSPSWMQMIPRNTARIDIETSY